MSPLALWFLAACSSPPPPAPAPKAAPRAAPAAAPAEFDENAAATTDEPGAPAAIQATRFVPLHPQKGDDIEVQLKVKNPAKHDVHFEYLWSINGTPSYDLTTNVFPGKQDTRGDQLSVKVTLTDGTHTDVKETPIVEVGNSPPTLQTTAAEFSNLDGLQVRATDPDDDTLSYSLEGAPSSLTIDGSGRISYDASETEKGGTYAITLVVDDGHTGYAKLPFKITVAGGATEQRVKKGADGTATSDGNSEQTSP